MICFNKILTSIFNIMTWLLPFLLFPKGKKNNLLASLTHLSTFPQVPLLFLNEPYKNSKRSVLKTSIYFKLQIIKAIKLD